MNDNYLTHPLFPSDKDSMANVYKHYFGDYKIVIQSLPTNNVWISIINPSAKTWDGISDLTQSESYYLADLLDKLSCDRKIALEMMARLGLHSTIGRVSR